MIKVSELFFFQYRVIAVGYDSSYGYIAMFPLSSISSYPDFAVGTLTMNALAAGTESITSTTVTIASVNTITGSINTYSNQSATYLLINSYTSDINSITTTQTISIAESSTMNVTPDLTCSKAGITSITYSISAYSSNAIPSWVSLNSGTGLLSITAPNVTADTTYPFYVVSTYSGATSPEQKLIQITVLN